MHRTSCVGGARDAVEWTQMSLSQMFWRLFVRSSTRKALTAIRVLRQVSGFSQELAHASGKQSAKGERSPTCRAGKENDPFSLYQTAARACGPTVRPVPCGWDSASTGRHPPPLPFTDNSYLARPPRGAARPPSTDRELPLPLGTNHLADRAPRSPPGGHAVAMTTTGSVVGRPVGDPPCCSTVTATASPGSKPSASTAASPSSSARMTPREIGWSPRTIHSS